MNKAKKIELTNKYNTNKIPQLTEYQKEWIRKETAHYIFVTKDENGNQKCRCERCNKEIDIGKTKHKATAVCPNCKKGLTVMHLWRNRFEETIDWVAIPKTIDGETLMLRYVMALRVGTTLAINEVARKVIRTGLKEAYNFELINGEWVAQRSQYFREFYMYNRRFFYCEVAKIYKPLWKRETKKIECLKYFPEFMQYVNPWYCVHSGMQFIMEKAPFYEKLHKAGLKELAADDFKNYSNYSDNSIKYNKKETTLTGMLGINRRQMKLLKENQSVKALNTIHEFKDTNIDLLTLIVQTGASKSQLKEIEDMKLSVIHTLRYILRAECNVGEWLHYVSLLKKLNYKLDNSYLYPKDFRKMDNSISDEYDEVFYAKEDAKRDAKIRKISKALQENKEIREFFKGSNGLQIFVPETSSEFRRESRYLHNCIKTYPDRVADGRTLLFFIRRIENPTEPYVAMEYKNGRIIQCRFDHNRDVTDEKIINFAEALAKKLREQNILAA